MGDLLSRAKLLTAGERGMVVDFGCEISADINLLVQQLARSLIQMKSAGITEVVPTYRSVMVYFDPMLLSRAELAAIIRRCLAEGGGKDAGQNGSRLISVPVCYGGVFGPDMDFVVRRTGLREEEVIEVHTSKPYLIYMLGFTPGFPYLGGLADKLVVPRLGMSRVKIPEGSVGIAEKQTGIYTVQSTGGWRLIGRTPLKLFNPDSSDPFLFAAGDYIKFEAVSVDDFFAIYREVEAGGYLPAISRMKEGEQL